MIQTQAECWFLVGSTATQELRIVHAVHQLRGLSANCVGTWI